MTRFNKKRLLLVLCISLLPFISYGQYDFTFHIKGSTDSMLVIGYYFGENTYASDTAYNKKGTYRFRGDKKLDPGIYFITNMRDHFFEFLVDDRQTITFSTQEDGFIRNMQVKGSETNKIYYTYLKENEKYSEAFQALKRKEKHLDSTVFHQQKDSINQLADRQKQLFMEKYPSHFLSKVFLAGKDPEIPPMPMPKKEDGSNDSAAWQQNCFKYYLEHYFDNVDLSCDGLLRTPQPIFHRKFKEYWNNMLQYQPSDTIIRYAVKWIETARSGEKMFQYFVHNITEHYLQSPNMGHDAIYVYMIKKYYATGDATWMSPSGIDSEVQRAEKWEHSLIGKVVPNISSPDSNNVFHNLYDIDKDFIVLIIWSPDCGHCATEVPLLHKFYTENKDRYNLEVFAMNSEEKTDDWTKFVRNQKLSWINVNGLVANFDWREYFDVKTTPFVLVLDKNKRIVAKRPQISHLGELLDAIKEGKLLF